MMNLSKFASNKKILNRVVTQPKKTSKMMNQN